MNRFLAGALVLLVLFSGGQAMLYNKNMKEARRAAAENSLLVASTQDSLKTINSEFGAIQYKYAIAVDDLTETIQKNKELSGRVRKLEKELGIKVSEISHLTATIDALEDTLDGQVTHTGDGTGFVTIVEDTLGIHLYGKVEWPSGQTSLSIKRDPLEFYITVQENETGLVAKSINFPGQPWITVKEWDIIVERSPKKSSLFEFMENPLGALLHPEPIAGLSFGTHGFGVDVGVQPEILQALVSLKLYNNRT